MRLATALICSALALTFAPVEAHIGRALQVPGVRSHHRGMRRGLSARATPTNEKEQASLKNENKQCGDHAPPNYESVRKNYPDDSKIASIQDGDDQAKQVWKEIQDSGIIPSHIRPRKGVQYHMGIAKQSTESYDLKSDPDCWWSATQCTKPKAKSLSQDIYECPEGHTYGLTFDDGPNCSHNAFYDFMQKNKLRATLFYIGLNVLNAPLQAQRGLADGHDICVHTWSHHYMTTLSNEQVFAELYYTMRIIKEVLGVTPLCWRPPFGDTDDRVRAIASGLGLRTIIWSNDTDDWDIKPDGSEPTASIDAHYGSIISKGKTPAMNTKGVIVLSHELTDNTMNEFMRQFPEIKKAYQNIVPLSACMNATQPYAEENPKYSTFEEFINGKTDATGIPDLSQHKIQAVSKLDITKESKQTGEGGFGSKAKQPEQANQKANSSNDAGSSSSSSTQSGSNSASKPSTSSTSSAASGKSNASGASGASDASDSDKSSMDKTSNTQKAKEDTSRDSAHALSVPFGFAVVVPLMSVLVSIL